MYIEKIDFRIHQFRMDIEKIDFCIHQLNFTLTVHTFSNMYKSLRHIFRNPTHSYVPSLTI